MHLLYLDKDDALTERLVRIECADATHWKGVDLIKNKFRNFKRAGLFWAKPVADSQEQQDVFYRLLVTRLHADHAPGPIKNTPKKPQQQNKI